MIFVLAAVISLNVIAVVAGVRSRADHVACVGPEPLSNASHSWWPNSPVDDVYTTWFNANSRCGEALRAWREAAPAARPEAHRAYQLELELEAAAAAELELYAAPLAA
jgi:hypothetical protein